MVLSGCKITDDTSSSGSQGTVAPDVTVSRFVDIRMASIQKEATQGEGENLDALADLMGKKDEQAFYPGCMKIMMSCFSDLEKPSQLLPRINDQSRKSRT